MKKHLSIVLFGIAAISLTGCYTQLVIEENDDSYVYQEPYYPVPDPIILPEEPYYPPTNPVEPEYKTRPIKRPPGSKIRNPGRKRDPITPPKRDDFRNPGKIREPVTPPPVKDRIRDDIRKRSGSNQDGKKSRR